MLCMDTKQKKTYSKEERKKRNKRFNTVLYIISAVLVLTGVIIIISDTTLWFDKLFHPGDFNEIPVPTGNFVFITPDPNVTFAPGNTPEPGEEVPDPHRTLAPGETEAPDDPSKPTATPRPQNPERPINVYFSGYNITCPIDPVGFNWKGQMATIRAHNRAAWLRTSGTPTEGGNIILAGHNKYSGKLGYFDVVRSKLKVGDIVIIENAHHDFYYYAVTSVTTYPHDGVPWSVMDTGGEPRLTLITCLGDFDSSIGSSKHRVIAVCHPITFDTGEGGDTGDTGE